MPADVGGYLDTGEESAGLGPGAAMQLQPGRKGRERGLTRERSQEDNSLSRKVGILCVVHCDALGWANQKVAILYPLILPSLSVTVNGLVSSRSGGGGGKNDSPCIHNILH